MKHLRFTYYTLDNLQTSDLSKKIPQKEGIYSWVVWQKFNPKSITINDLKKILQKYTTIDLNLSENFESYKFLVRVRENTFKNCDTFFGLKKSREKKLLKFLENESNRILFSNFLKEIYFSRPFYIGKAINLKSRLKKHLNDNSKILELIRDSDILFNNIWVGYKETYTTNDSEISLILEEIMQRVLKPGLTEKPG